MEELKTFEDTCNWANTIDTTNIETTICLSWKSFGYLIIGLIIAFITLTFFVIYIFNNSSTSNYPTQNRYLVQEPQIVGYDNSNQPVYSSDSRILSNRQ